MLTANYKYCRNKMDNLKPPVQMQLSAKLKTFALFSIALFDSALYFEPFEKIMCLIAQLFLNLYTPKHAFT